MFKDDSQEELDLMVKLSKQAGADEAVLCQHWAKGGAGARELASAVHNACQKRESNFKFLYDSPSAH